MQAPVIAVTAGDPCGIGPEIILKTLARGVPSRARLIIIGDHAVFERTARRLRRRLPAWRIIASRSWRSAEAAKPPLTFLDAGRFPHAIPGRSSREAGAASLAYLDLAISLWRHGRVHALVTAPVTKWAVRRVEPSFVGHTEYLARAMGAREVLMMFASDALRVVLLTRHLPLARVPAAITGPRLRRALQMTASSLRREFGIRRPRIAVCGINPHAGEASPESVEQAIMRPVLRSLRRRGLSCDGPFAADGFFASARGYDAVVCGYHDQGLIPFKMAARDRGCQVTVGLPIIRTSPDHGSALDIAGTGIANPGSMRYALALAAMLSSRG